MRFRFENEEQLTKALAAALDKAEEAAYRLKVTTTQERRRIQIHEIIHALFANQEIVE